MEDDHFASCLRMLSGGKIRGGRSQENFAQSAAFTLQFPQTIIFEISNMLNPRADDQLSS